MVTAEVKVEPEVEPNTSGGGEQVISKQVKCKVSYDSDQFDDGYPMEYCEAVDMPYPMTISKKSFVLNHFFSVLKISKKGVRKEEQ